MSRHQKVIQAGPMAVVNIDGVYRLMPIATAAQVVKLLANSLAVDWEPSSRSHKKQWRPKPESGYETIEMDIVDASQIKPVIDAAFPAAPRVIGYKKPWNPACK